MLIVGESVRYFLIMSKKSDSKGDKKVALRLRLRLRLQRDFVSLFDVSWAGVSLRMCAYVCVCASGKCALPDISLQISLVCHNQLDSAPKAAKDSKRPTLRICQKYSGRFARSTV